MQPDYSTVPTSALVGLARLILKRTRLSLPVDSREQAIGIIRGIRPAPPRKSKINIKPRYELCCVCWKPMIVGSMVDTLGRNHIQCQGGSHEV